MAEEDMNNQDNTTNTATGDQPASKDFLVTAMLSLFLGWLGVDRFYLAKVGTGILKLITFGAFGIWTLIDLILILTGNMQDKFGRPLKDRKKNLKVVLIVIAVVLALQFLLFAMLIGIGANTSQQPASDSQDQQQEQQESQDSSETAQIGEAARDGKFEFTVEGINCGSQTVGTGIVQEEAQGQYCLLSLNVENVGDSAQSLTASNLYLYDEQDREFTADSAATSTANDQSISFFLNQINPGNSVSGQVVFDVPQNANIVRAKLHDSAFSSGVEVNLE